MTLNRVDSWEIACNGCGKVTGDLGEYAFWAEPDSAIDQWRDSDGIVLDEANEAYCSQCLYGGVAPLHICRYGDAPDYAHTIEDDNRTYCVECDTTVALHGRDIADAVPTA